MNWEAAVVYGTATGPSGLGSLVEYQYRGTHLRQLEPYQPVFPRITVSSRVIASPRDNSLLFSGSSLATSLFRSLLTRLLYLSFVLDPSIFLSNAASSLRKSGRALFPG